MKIKKLILSTSNLAAQVSFYRDTLGFQLTSEDSTCAEFRTGNSILRFEVSENHTPYHFAFNIPSHQEADAQEWLRERVSILDFESEEIIRFESWNARAIYFYDQDQNIIEFIARRNLGYEDIVPFSVNSVIEISEIGVPVEDIVPVYEHMQTELYLPVYSGSTERFCAIGDERGLFIVINKNVKTSWFPTEDSPKSSDFKVIIYQKGQLYKVTFHNQNLFSHELKSNHYSFNQLA